MPKKTPPAGGIGQPRKDPTPADVKKIETLIGDNGVTHIELARCLNIDKRTLYRWRDQFPEVREAMEAGLAKEHKALRSVLLEKALAGDTVCLLFSLKTRHHYRETAPVENESRVNISINLPGALSAEQYGKVIEHE